MTVDGTRSLADTERVGRLIGAMTLLEKLSFVHGSLDPESRGQAGYIPGAPRLGIPPLRLADGPAGIHVRDSATALPAPVMLASAFDDDLAAEYGQVLGREARALGQHVVLSPMVNLIRTPFGGRNFETFSEDPVQSARVAVRQIVGIQSEGAMATVKHLAMNNQEHERQTLDVRVDEAVLRELELVPFEAAVQAGVATVMGAYNKVNGVYSCENADLLNSILRDEWGFRGWVMSDWRATHSTEAIAAGLDQEMPSGVYFDDPLARAIRAGDVAESVLDTSVARILGQMVRFGMLDRCSDAHDEVLTSFEVTMGDELALRVAERGAVLLHNEHETLPLSRDLRRIAVIGFPAVSPVIGGAGSSQVHARDTASPLDELRRHAPDTEFVHRAGIDFESAPIPITALDPALPEDGMVLGYAEAAEFRAKLAIDVEGFYQFIVRAPQSISLLTIDGVNVLRGARNGQARGGVHLTKGDHTFALSLTAIRSADLVVVEWVRPEGQQAALDAAVEAAAAADATIVFAFDVVTEGWDRPDLDLPFRQNELISAVAEVGKSTTVILHTGSGVSMPWLDAVHAVLEMYFPGQNGGRAVARLLYGDVNPSGKLTQTFPASVSTTPVAGDLSSYPGVDSVLTHREGADMGYRWYRRSGTRSLFPFGHGLSYTRFALGDLRVRRRNDVMHATVDVANAGKRAGTEVVQLYAELVEHDGTSSPPVLADYVRVALFPGQSTTIDLAVEARVLRSWDSQINGWGADRAIRRLHVGTSSERLDLRTEPLD